MVEFCPKCGRMLRPQRSGEKTLLVCPQCGYAREPSGTGGYRVVQQIDREAKKETVIIEGQETQKLLPTVRAECPRCGNLEAFWWLVQTRRADEGSTRFFRCTKCGFTWREYD